jgi:hypothetical protein
MRFAEAKYNTGCRCILGKLYNDLHYSFLALLICIKHISADVSTE